MHLLKPKPFNPMQSWILLNPDAEDYYVGYVNYKKKLLVQLLLLNQPESGFAN